MLFRSAFVGAEAEGASGEVGGAAVHGGVDDEDAGLHGVLAADDGEVVGDLVAVGVVGAAVQVTDGEADAGDAGFGGGELAVAIAGDAELADAEGVDIEVRVGAGSYVCGEETAMLESLEGKRGMVRAKPPIPALQGLHGKPTVVNNVLTLATIPMIVADGDRKSTRLNSSH